MKQTLHLKETELKNIITESVKKILNEYYIVNWKDGTWSEYDSEDDAKQAAKKHNGWVTWSKPKSHFGQVDRPNDYDDDDDEPTKKDNINHKECKVICKYYYSQGGGDYATFLHYPDNKHYGTYAKFIFLHWGKPRQEDYDLCK